MFTVYCLSEKCKCEKGNFLSLDNAVKYAINCSLCMDVEYVDIISAETGELLFAFEKGVLTEISPAICYEY